MEAGRKKSIQSSLCDSILFLKGMVMIDDKKEVRKHQLGTSCASGVFPWVRHRWSLLTHEQFFLSLSGALLPTFLHRESSWPLLGRAQDGSPGDSGGRAVQRGPPGGAAPARPAALH
ncbi:hypothetical protein H8959_019984 [Pygathrix nigripes]